MYTTLKEIKHSKNKLTVVLLFMIINTLLC